MEQGAAQTVRCFVALEVPLAVREALGGMQGRLRPLLASYRPTWVKPSNIHLTLKFLGAVPAAVIEEVKRSLRFLTTVPSFDLQLTQGGCFPDARRPRVLWVGYAALAPLATLQRAVEEAMVPLGFGREKRPFAAHLTLARFKEAPRDSRVGNLASILASEQPMLDHRADAVALFQSRLTAHGAEYTIMEAYALTNS